MGVRCRKPDKLETGVSRAQSPLCGGAQSLAARTHDKKTGWEMIKFSVRRPLRQLCAQGKEAGKGMHPKALCHSGGKGPG